MAVDNLTEPAHTVWSLLRAVLDLGLTRDTVHRLLPDRTPDDLDTDLARLVATTLLHRTGGYDTARFRVPDIARRDHDDEPDTVAGLLRLIEHYAIATAGVAEAVEPDGSAFSDLRDRPASRFPDRVAALAWFTAERATIPAVQHLAVDLGRDDRAWRIGEGAWTPCGRPAWSTTRWPASSSPPRPPNEKNIPIGPWRSPAWSWHWTGWGTSRPPSKPAKRPYGWPRCSAIPGWSPSPGRPWT
ncbi:hypothetical protein [Saccharothrix lopnurensis]|uniref:Uncharacterized protein n=1 Tax=Saccharothrix lopnurensis TaxID=1670621 RepID=A0ABW1PF25_9PSEU